MGHLAAVNQAGVLERTAVHLGMDHAQPPGQVKVEPDVLEFGAVERRHVDGEPDLAPHQVIRDQPRSLDGNRHLSFLGRCAQMRSDKDLGMLDQREVDGRRLGIEGVNGCAAKLAAGERLDQGGLVDQAAPRAVDDSHRRLHHADRAGVDEVAQSRH